MELVDIVSSRFSCITVLGDTSPDLILYNQHPDFFQLIAQFINVVTHQTILNIYIGSVIKHLQRTFNIDFKGSCNMMRFLFFLLQKGIIQVLQNRHILRFGIIKISLINLMHTTVNDRLFDRLQSVLATYNQLTKGQDKICFQCHRIVVL